MERGLPEGAVEGRANRFPSVALARGEPEALVADSVRGGMEGEEVWTGDGRLQAGCKPERVCIDVAAVLAYLIHHASDFASFQCDNTPSDEQLQSRGNGKTDRRQSN